ncbi:TPA: hypothetical protein ACIVQC_001874, partial [Salmonella enterica subsp. diarizonae serovar 61:l,v:z35]
NSSESYNRVSIIYDKWLHVIQKFHSTSVSNIFHAGIVLSIICFSSGTAQAAIISPTCFPPAS